MHPPESAVIALRITAQPARPHVAQHGFFAAHVLEAGRMEILLAQLRKLVGEGRVGSPELLDSYASEAFRVTNFEIAQAASCHRACTHSSHTLALRLVRPLRAVSVELHDERPKTIHYEGQWLKLQTVSGPWRTDGEWWTQSAWNCEEWDVSVDEKQQRCLCLAHDPAAHCWYVIGIYD
jgi:protein ImuB